VVVVQPAPPRVDAREAEHIALEVAVRRGYRDPYVRDLKWKDEQFHWDVRAEGYVGHKKAKLHLWIDAETGEILKLKDQSHPSQAHGGHHGDKGDYRGDKGDHRGDKSDHRGDKADKHGNKADKHGNKADKHGNKADKHGNKADKHGDKGDRHADKGQQHGNKGGKPEHPGNHKY
jgi:hypothetical protein